jgi:hypothetical protein
MFDTYDACTSSSFRSGKSTAPLIQDVVMVYPSPVCRMLGFNTYGIRALAYTFVTLGF